MSKNDQAEKSGTIKKNALLKMIFMSVLWIVLFALSFITFYAIPAVIFVSWVIIAWLIKAIKADNGGDSGYDSEF